MSRPRGTANAGIRYDAEHGEFLLRCASCTKRHLPSFWPLTLEFWNPRVSMIRCRACIAEERRAADRAAYAALAPEARERRLAASRAQRHAQRAFAYKERYERIKADPIAYAAYLEDHRHRSRAYRARLKEAA